MAATTIQFIQNPPYRVDFRDYAKQKPAEAASLSSRVQSAVAAPFILVKVVIVSVAKAGYETLRYSGTSFKYIVLGYYGSWRKWQPPSDLYLAVFKVIFWVGAMGWCFAATTVRELYKHTQSPAEVQNILSQFAGNEINVSHIKTNDLAIDMSGVPADVTVNQLVGMFDEINFDRPNESGYMAEGSRQGNTKEGLKESLQKFINDVNGRVAFLGTPPAYDMPRLLAFYQQLENAVRFSIHKSNQDLRAFRTENPNGPYRGAILQQYKNLLEDQARIPLMLAIAGKYCGARYMGEAMELYDAAKGEGSMAGGTLRDALIDILAAKRKEIARAHIQEHVAKKNSRGQPIADTHDYTNYMSSLGQILAIPGTANVIEHLSKGLDRPRFLKLFFADYTVDAILEAVQAKIKKSGILQGKIVDWLKMKRGEVLQSNPATGRKDTKWVPVGGPSMEQMMAEGNKVLKDNKPAPKFVPYQSLQNLRELIAHLQQPLPSHADWDEFLIQLFVSGKQWLNTKYPNNPMAQAETKNNIRALFSEDPLGQALVAKTKEAIAGNKQLVIEPFFQQLLAPQKVEKLGAILKLSEGTAMRVVEGKKLLQQAIEEQRAQSHDSDFAAGLLQNIETAGLSPEMLEWLLVDQEILLTQAGG